MALIRINNFEEIDTHQSNSVELMANWQAWLSESQPFVILDSGSNSLKILQGSFFTLKQPFRWYRIVEEDNIVTQAHIDVGGNFKEETTYQLYLIDNGSNGSLAISESDLSPVGSQAQDCLWLAQFQTKEHGVIEATSIIDSQMNKFALSLPKGSLYTQLPTMAEPQVIYPRTTWQEISQQYAGDFLRVAGGLASAFGSGRQAGSIPNITGILPIFPNPYVLAGAFYEDSHIAGALNRLANNTISGQYDTRTYFDASKSSATYGRRNEVAPQNQTIRLWIKES
ncbi:hypothetical protein PVA45_07180 (plasmid) [Entomospira entomophila]|uniref:Uncharacterized protein n=1 Tax=Entomospira entomophila TaxID=2719988 RepID=A0A968GF85_9SPIO|nr:hypothetical protein [Entomospira entomophilus]NIZ41359.1 hypothetical protein [Entomospira entomophilus]WDI36230.1 hypothetical protein PVA45_07180 [Entomospira entomophilus]